MDQELLGFPLWLRINHFINLFCIFVLMRSGVQILADHPKLYWNDDTTPENEWIKFGKKVMPKDRTLTTLRFSRILGRPPTRRDGLSRLFLSFSRYADRPTRLAMRTVDN